MTPREEAAVEAAVRAVRAHERQSGHRTHASRSAADVLDDRLDLDWSSFDSRAYRLLREVRGRTGAAAPTGRSPEFPRERGAKYEDTIHSARERLSGAYKSA